MKSKLVYTGIRVKDMDASIKFYTEVLDMKLKGRNSIESTNGEVAGLISESGGPEIELNYYKDGSKYFEPYASGQELDHLAFQVEDLDKFLAEAKKLGYDAVLEVKSPTSKWAYIQDPNGIYIELFT
jgi:catechol 2,3-dioxygenase-like lactoylglutathione lyase family enzyme